MRLRLLIAALFLFGFTESVFALQLTASEGESSFNFLKFSLSPRSTALGGAGVALVDRVADADLNPAAAGRDSGGVALGQIYLQSTSGTGSFAAWNIPWDDLHFTGQVRYLGYDDLAGYDGNNVSTAAYGAHLIKLQGGATGRFAGFDLGAGVAFVQNNIADQTYGAGLLNLGARRDLLNGFSAGLSVMNADFWTSKALDGSSLIAPTILQAGAAYTRALPHSLQVAVAADIRKPNDENLSVPVGVELTWQEILSARVGYPLLDDNAALSMGFGLQWSRYGFEYAYQGSAVISGSHLWALEIRY